MVRLILEINKSDLSGFWYDVADLNFLYFAIFSFLSCIALMIGVSVLTPEPDLEQIEGLTFDTVSKKQVDNSSENLVTKEYFLSFMSKRTDKINSIIIICILILILILFSPLGLAS
tara:strand:+ start:196 stop:543 length:348 start_codon:yes stop_codon:yes gene_type:complete